MTRISFCPVCSQRLRIKVSNGWIAWNTSNRCQKTVEFNPEFDTELCFALCVRTGEGWSLQFTPMKESMWPVFCLSPRFTNRYDASLPQIRIIEENAAPKDYFSSLICLFCIDHRGHIDLSVSQNTCCSMQRLRKDLCSIQIEYKPFRNYVFCFWGNPWSK